MLFRSVVLVPYVMPGFALARACAGAYEQAVTAGATPEGMVLLRHGLFSFGDTARQSYDRMIALVELAEARLARGARRFEPVPLPERPVDAAALLPQLRGALARAAGVEQAPRRWILDLRDTPLTRAVSDDARLADWAGRGVATPDHVIRTKAAPLVLPPEASPAAIEQAMEAYGRAYRAKIGRAHV